MSTVAVKIYLEDPYQEFLIAELADLDFEAFQQEDDHFVAYIPSALWTDAKREEIEAWLATHGRDAQIEEELISDQNWNEQWEETIAPVAVPPFLIKPTWRDVPPEYRDLILLEIDPKMSFGTGYHESTRLVLRLLPHYVRQGHRVLDAGTGTGILAIAAVRLGAIAVDAFDIDPWSQENAVENFLLNEVSDRVRMHAGTLEDVPPAHYDCILANINLNVIAGLAGAFSGRLGSGGVLITSGVMARDRDRLLDAAAASGFRLERELLEGEWMAAVFSAT